MLSASIVGNLVTYKETVTKPLKVSDLKIPGVLTEKYNTLSQRSEQAIFSIMGFSKYKLERRPMFPGVPR